MRKSCSHKSLFDGVFPRACGFLCGSARRSFVFPRKRPALNCGAGVSQVCHVARLPAGTPRSVLIAAVPNTSARRGGRSDHWKSARIFLLWQHFPAKKAGFHFAGKCSKTSAATVNRCGSGFPEGSRPATFRQRTVRSGKTDPAANRSALLGRRQVVRQGILIPPCGGSNPPAPASQCTI